jgi:hypothetical protein
MSLLCKNNIVSNSKEEITGSNLAQSPKEGYGKFCFPSCGGDDDDDDDDDEEEESDLFVRVF